MDLVFRPSLSFLAEAHPRLKQTRLNNFIFWLRGSLVNSDIQGTNIMRIYKCLANQLFLENNAIE
jgi:hypothetical protein